MNKFFTFIKSCYKKDSVESETNNRIYALRLFLYLGLVVSIAFTTYGFLNSSYRGLLISLSFLLVITTSLFHIKETKHFKRISNGICIFLFIILIIMFITGGSCGYDFLWLYIYPAICIFLHGIVIGSIYNFLFLITNIILFLLPYESYTFPLFSDEFIYTTPMKIEFLSVYICVSAVAIICEYVRLQNRLKLSLTMEELKRSNQSSMAKTEFILELSHQIRTPLSSIMGIVNILKKTNITQSQKELFDGIDISINNLVNVIDNIVNVSSLKTNDNVSDNWSFDLRNSINTNIDKLRNSIIDNNFICSINIADDVPQFIISNPDKINDLILNISQIVNENFHHNANGIQISITKKKETTNAIELLIEIQSELNNRLSTPINNILNTKSNLANAKKTVESLGGIIGTSNVDTKIEVWFTLLTFKAHDLNADSIIPSKSTDNTNISTSRLATANVLVVEDNLLNQKVIKLSIKDKVASIDVANDGKEAVDKVAKTHYDLILMDIQMPIMDGYKATAKIRAMESNGFHKTPIIALTANAMLGDREKCIEAGMDEYISKPFKVDELIAKMENIINQNY